MAEDLVGMKARIALEIRRDDLTTEIAAAITTAISQYQKERFRFSDITPLAPPTFATVADRNVYDAADNANIGSMFYIEAINVLIGTTLEMMQRETPEDILLLNQEGASESGQPESWAYQGNSIIIYPTPNQAYTLYLVGHILIAAPLADDTAGNKWMTYANGELLIRSRAKFELATHVTRNEKMAVAMSPDPPAPGSPMGATYRAFCALKGEGNRIVARGRVRSMQF